MTMTLIETKTLGTAQASIEFTSIPQDGTDLVALASLRSTNASYEDEVSVTFNGVSTNRSHRVLLGNGSGNTSFSDTSIRIFGAGGANATSNTFGNAVVYIPNYAGSTNKSVSIDSVSENNATSAIQTILAGLWANTAAITSITFTGAAGNLIAGSTISLYKITKGTDGTTVVS